ncbi:centaurin/arf [Anaeramoeba flamelloides]|uniref:Centaurin/arf n=1 Tax=Anaeramoeba flamelloides TaxID=1746091 RepID=A0AAV7ZIG3_9EUKA|nr:centaurin/arf [Anaeramoeba flamelloides]
MSKNKRLLKKNSKTKNNNVITILFIGPKSGKTQLINRFISIKYNPIYTPTKIKSIIKKKKIEGVTLKLEIIEIGSDPKNSKSLKENIPKADGILLTYSVNDYSTFEKILDYKKILTHNLKDSKTPILLVGLGSDDPVNKQVTSLQGQTKANKLGTYFIEVSSKKDVGIKTAILSIIRLVKEHKELKKQQKDVIDTGDIVIDHPIIEGWIKKKASVGWTKLWCSLQDGTLYFFKKKGTIRVFKDKLQLLMCNTRASTAQTNTIDIISSTKNFTIQLESQEAMLDWIDEIQNSVSRITNKLNSSKISKKAKQVGCLSNKKENGMNGKKGTENPSSINEVLSPLTEMRRFSPNHNCAECGLQNPSFVSFAFGSVICMRCSHIYHQVFGGGSLIKSLLFSPWLPQELFFMKALGNDINKKIWEHNLKSKRLNSKSSNEKIRKFVKEKYLGRKWMDRKIVSLNEKQKRAHFINAIKRNDLYLALNLIKAGIDINEPIEGEQGMRPLHVACRIGNLLTVLLLCFNGAYLNIQDDEGTKPSEIALDYGFKDITKLIDKHLPMTEEKKKENLESQSTNGSDVETGIDMDVNQDNINKNVDLVDTNKDLNQEDKINIKKDQEIEELYKYQHKDTFFQIGKLYSTSDYCFVKKKILKNKLSLDFLEKTGRVTKSELAIINKRKIHSKLNSFLLPSMVPEGVKPVHYVAKFFLERKGKEKKLSTIERRQQISGSGIRISLSHILAENSAEKGKRMVLQMTERRNEKLHLNLAGENTEGEIRTMYFTKTILQRMSDTKTERGKCIVFFTPSTTCGGYGSVSESKK